MTVSVVIPTYNAVPFLAETLASVFAQTHLPDEVIVVDDCSPDGTVALVEALAATAPVPVRVIRMAQNSGGPARPLNAGVAAARGDLIATLDHDDAFAPTKLASQVPAFLAYPSLGLVFGEVRCVGPDGDAALALERWGRDGVARIPRVELPTGVHVISSADATAALVGSLCFAQTCSNMLFPKAVWRACGGFDERCTVSADFAFLAAVSLRYPVGYLPTPSAAWRVRPDSLYRAAPGRVRVRDILRVYGTIWAGRLPASVRGELRSAIREVAFEGAYGLRKAGDPRGAGGCLAAAVRVVGPWRGAAVEFAKLLPDLALRRPAWRPPRRPTR